MIIKVKHRLMIICLGISIGASGQYVPRFREYVPQVPLEVLAQAGMYKQQLYEKRYENIQGEIKRLFKVVNSLFNESTLPNNYNALEYRSYYWSEFTKAINSKPNIDLSDINEYYRLINIINTYEQWFYDSYNKIIKN